MPPFKFDAFVANFVGKLSPRSRGATDKVSDKVSDIETSKPAGKPFKFR